jgi:hypothetical protein
MMSQQSTSRGGALAAAALVLGILLVTVAAVLVLTVPHGDYTLGFTDTTPALAFGLISDKPIMVVDVTDATAGVLGLVGLLIVAGCVGRTLGRRTP